MKRLPVARYEEGEFGDRAWLLTLDGKRVVSIDDEKEARQAAIRINAILQEHRQK